MHFGRRKALAAQNKQPGRIRPGEEKGARGRRGSGPSSIPSLLGTYLAEAKAWQPLSGPYQCCLRWRAFGARAPRADPWKGVHPRMGPEPWNWRVLAATLGKACLQSSHPRFSQLALPPRALPPPVAQLTQFGRLQTSEDRQAGSRWG